MPYITNVERFGIEKGRQEGREEGRAEGQQEAMFRILEVRFADIPSKLIEQVRKIENLEILGELLTQAVTAQSLQAFEEVVNEYGDVAGEEDNSNS